MTTRFHIITAVLHLEKNNLTKLDSNSFRGMRFMRRLYFNDNQIRSVRNTFVYSIFVFAFPLLQWQPDHIISYHRHIISYDIISSCLIKVGRQTFQAMGRIVGIHLRCDVDYDHHHHIIIIPYHMISLCLSCLIKVGRQTFQAMGRIGGIHLRGNRLNITQSFHNPHPCHRWMQL